MPGAVVEVDGCSVEAGAEDSALEHAARTTAPTISNSNGRQRTTLLIREQ
jgi:hypothetical protein